MKSKEQKRIEAEARQAARNARTDEEQKALLASRPGFSERERVRMHLRRKLQP